MYEISQMNLLSWFFSDNGKAVTGVYLHVLPLHSVPLLDKQASPHAQMSNTCLMMNGGWEFILSSPLRYQNPAAEVNRFPGGWPAPLFLVASVLPFASSSYQHVRAFGEAEYAVTHQQDRDSHAKSNTTPPSKQLSRRRSKPCGWHVMKALGANHARTVEEE